MPSIVNELLSSRTSSGGKSPSPAAPASWLWIYTTLAGSLMLRLTLLDFESGDYHLFLSRWYDFLVEHGQWQGLGVIQEETNSYPPLYFYFLSLSTLLPLPKLHAIKLISMIGDYLGALFVWQLVRHGLPAWERGWAAVSLFLFLPTTLMNAAVWGQCDILYTCGFLASLYYLMERRALAALVAFGFSCALKPQAIFWCPFLAGLLVTGRLPWKWVWVPAAVYVGCGIPAVCAGRPLVQVLGHWGQVNNTPGLTLGATNWYQWVFEQHPEIFYWPGIVLTVVAAAFLVLWMGQDDRNNGPEGGRGEFPPDIPSQCAAAATADICSRTTDRSIVTEKLPSLFDDPARLVSFALLSVLLPPFFLPGMHERYFFPADVLSIVYTFYVRGGWRVAVLVQFASAFTYLPYLFHQEPIPRPLLALVMTFAIALVIRELAELRLVRFSKIRKVGNYSANTTKES